MADLYSLYRLVTMKIRSRSQKSNKKKNSALPTIYLCKFGQNPSAGSEDNAETELRKRGRRQIPPKTKSSLTFGLGGHNSKVQSMLKTAACTHIRRDKNNRLYAHTLLNMGHKQLLFISHGGTSVI